MAPGGILTQITKNIIDPVAESLTLWTYAWRLVGIQLNQI